MVTSIREAYELLLKRAFPYEGWPYSKDEEMAIRIIGSVIDYIEDKNINIVIKKKGNRNGRYSIYNSKTK